MMCYLAHEPEDDADYFGLDEVTTKLHTKGDKENEQTQLEIPC